MCLGMFKFLGFKQCVLQSGYALLYKSFLVHRYDRCNCSFGAVIVYHVNASAAHAAGFILFMTCLGFLCIAVSLRIFITLLGRGPVELTGIYFYFTKKIIKKNEIIQNHLSLLPSFSLLFPVTVTPASCIFS